MANDLIKKMKHRIENSGANRKEVLYFPADSKRRVRFLQELDTGFEYKFHSRYTGQGSSNNVNAFCMKSVGLDCPYCDAQEDDLGDVYNYGWSVFDYETNSVKIMLFKATGITPVASFIEFNDEYGTLLDRDYTIKKNGKGISGSYTVIPGEISEFRNKKNKPLSNTAMTKMLAVAFPPNANDMDGYEAFDPKAMKADPPKKSAGKKKATTKKKKKKVKTIQEKFEELELSELKEVSVEIGMTKKELRGLDEEEIVELLFDDYEEEDLEEMLESYLADNEDDYDEEDDD